MYQELPSQFQAYLEIAHGPMIHRKSQASHAQLTVPSVIECQIQSLTRSNHDTFTWKVSGKNQALMVFAEC